MERRIHPPCMQHKQLHSRKYSSRREEAPKMLHCSLLGRLQNKMCGDSKTTTEYGVAMRCVLPPTSCKPTLLLARRNYSSPAPTLSFCAYCCIWFPNAKPLKNTPPRTCCFRPKAPSPLTLKQQLPTQPKSCYSSA